MKRGINLFIVLVVGCVPLSVHADPIVIDVPDHCTVSDTGGVPHTFPQQNSPNSYLGVCLLEAARDAGFVTFSLTNDINLGLYVQSINGILPGATEYWALWVNGAMASCGIGCTSLTQGDTLSFILTDWMTNVESTTVALRAQSLIVPAPPPISGSKEGGGGIPSSSLNLTEALAYLTNAQKEDGSFGSLMLSDWVAIAFAAADPGEAKTKLREYLRTATTSFSVVTDYERHAMALEALGVDPSLGTDTDYISPIVNAFDGTQIGDVHLDNDDIFALFPLLAAGYGAHDRIIQKTVAFILSAQGANGSWDNSADMTAAAIQALIPVRMLPDVSLALIRAEGYLRSQSNIDPDTSFTTSWVRQAISALSWTPSGWTQNAFTKRDYLAELQQSDGGVEPDSVGTQMRVWATAYAIPAAIGKSWPMLLQSFPKAVVMPASVVAILPPQASTSTPSVVSDTPRAELVGVQPKKQVSAEISFPILVDVQTAAVVNARTGNIFNYMWNTFADFFKNFL